MFKSIKKLLKLLIFAALVALFVIYLPKLELKSPEITIEKNNNYLGLAPFDIIFEDKGQGLKSFTVSLVDDKQQILIAEKNYESGVSSDTITIKLDPSKVNIKEGPAKLLVKAEDFSRVKFFSGNKSKLKKDVIIDLTPPRINKLTSTQYINHGGAGFVIYRGSNDTEVSGIKIKDYFFRGYNKQFEDESIFVCYFAYPYDLSDKESINIISEDAAGNQTVLPINHELIKSGYRERSIKINESFVYNKMAPLLINEEITGLSMKQIFLKVNNELRLENNTKIFDITSKSSDKKLWDGKFSQLSNSQVEANFADKRHYELNGEEIDTQYHVGYDLSVTKQYPVEASNNGLVVYADDLGIYGNTVILDHGLGLMSLYSHLSMISVKVGDNVNKNDIIGNTGVTGLAGGDHLHFGIYIHGIPVRPLEWWDGSWIEKNISNKISKLDIKGNN